MDFNGFSKWLSDGINQILAVIMVLLPDSPFSGQILPDSIATILPYINWVVPFYMIGNTMLVWIGAIGVYYAYQVILRWAKAVQ